MKGAFFVFEGIEGAGKSTVIEHLRALLHPLGRELVVTREPGGTAVGKAIREIVLQSAEVLPTTELLLFAADRAQHVSELIRPAIERGAVVLCDRFLYSTLAYQGFGRGIDRALLDSLNTIATSGLTPDLTLLLDLPPEEGLRRAERRGTAWNRFEEQALEFHHRVRNGFLTLATEHNFLVLDATASKERLAAEAFQAIQARLR
jgi:dTMP kinase